MALLGEGIITEFDSETPGDKPPPEEIQEWDNSEVYKEQ